MAHNVTHEVKGGKLIITVVITPATCEAAPPSTSGKTLLVGTTSGAINIQSPPGWALNFSLNVMAKQTSR